MNCISQTLSAEYGHIMLVSANILFYIHEALHERGMTMKAIYRKVTMHFVKNQNSSVIFIDNNLLKHWEIQEGDSLNLIAGCKKVTLTVRTLSGSSSTALISENSAQILCLAPFGFPVQMAYCPKGKTLSIGPYLAILTSSSSSGPEPFGEYGDFLREMAEYCKEHGYPFYAAKLQRITPGETLEGYWFNGKWETSQFPLPDAVYNRIGSRKLERSALFQDFSDQLKKRRIPMFNGCFLSKWEVHELLRCNADLLPNLPDCIPLKEEESFASFLQKFSSVYVKPAFGSQGKNIIKLSKTEEGWVVEHSDGIKDTYLAEAEELFRMLSKISRKTSYIAQKGISLLEIDDKKVDFRVLMNKNKHGMWKVTSMVARIGYAGHIVSNLSRGGEMKNGMEFLSSIFEQTEARRLCRILKEIALKTAHTLSDSREDLFGELGIDLALDTESHPWIIEVNSKPSKKFQGNYEKFRPSVKSVIEYMNYLCTKGELHET
ncbi:YheC/D like ATP-grasp [Bacillus sp. OV322]|uniref:YheC/YheD family endospore coat-associated protein n=1 Tax=Bacillus sp. OV322 TaxID=1882764 RepID=UPI0008ECA38D|nr:YheC/YheD family protein [Bacillus sp. OV322]SFB95089.1 YheC/D like ATP-grasp [Bacillus sp. OV322]